MQRQGQQDHDDDATTTTTTTAHNLLKQVSKLAQLSSAAGVPLTLAKKHN